MPNCEHIYALDQFRAAAQHSLRSRKSKIDCTDHAHRIRTEKAISSRRAARMPEHISHVKVMIILGGLLLSVRPAAPWRVPGTDVGSLWWLVASAADELT
jgi:hypothetical protein